MSMSGRLLRIEATPCLASPSWFVLSYACTMSGRVAETIQDFDDALPDICSGDPTVRRRAYDALFQAVFRLREHQVDRVGSAKRYFDIVRAEYAGQVTEAVVAVRHIAEHELDKIVTPPDAPLYPSTKLYPGRWTFPGWNPVWTDLPADSEVQADARAWYDQHLHGTIVGYTCDSARWCLVESSLFGPPLGADPPWKTP